MSDKNNSAESGSDSSVTEYPFSGVSERSGKKSNCLYGFSFGWPQFLMDIVTGLKTHQKETECPVSSNDDSFNY